MERLAMSPDPSVGQWPKVRLSDGLVSGIQPGFACGNHNRTGDGIVHVRPFNVTTGGEMDFSSIKHIPGAEAHRPERLLAPGDVVFNNTNSPELVGKTALYQETESMAFSNHMTRIRVNSDRLRPEYLALSLHQLWREGYFAEKCNNHVSQASISRAVLLESEIPVPSLEIQDALISKFRQAKCEIDRARDRLATIPTLLKKFRQSVLAAACSGQLTADWRELQPTPSAEELLSDLIQMRQQMIGPKSKLPVQPDPDAEYDVPESWVVASIDSLSTKVADGVHKTPNYQPSGIPFVTVRNLTFGPGISFEKLNYISEADHAEFTARTKPERGDILISKDGTIGTVRVINTDREFSIFVSVALVKVADKRITPYLEVALNCPAVQGRMSRTGTGLQHLVLRDLRQLAIPLPPLDEQAEIVRRVESLFALADSIESRLSEATAQVERTTQAILAKAFRGEL